MAKQNTQRTTSPKPETKTGGAAKKRPLPSGGYDVCLSASAERAYLRFVDLAEKAQRRGDLTNRHCTTLRMVDDALENVIPRDPFNRRYALSGALSNIFRIQKGRLRICWIGSSEYGRICILFISETLRKAGDVNDPYKLLTSLLMSGELDPWFEELGVRNPRGIRTTYPILTQ